MNDEFLTKLQKTPRPEFAEALYERLSRPSQPPFAQALRQRLTLRNSMIMMALLFLVAACVYAVTDRGWRKVGGIWVQVDRTYKVTLGPSISVTAEELEAQEMDCVTVEEAKEILRFDFRVPAWVPEGFRFEDKICGIDGTSDYAVLYWAGADEYTSIQLMLTNLKWFNMATQEYKAGEPTIWGPVAPGSYKEVQVKGEPAVLVRGEWDYLQRGFAPLEEKTPQEIVSKWDSKAGLQLHWAAGDVMYHLYAWQDVSAEDLIRMAESAQ